MVITLALHDAVTPAGKPVEAPIPVAPVVAIVMDVIAALAQTVGAEEGIPAVFGGVIAIVRVVVFAQSPAVGVNV